MIKVKYIGKGEQRIRLNNTGDKVTIKKDEIVEIDKSQLPYFNQYNFIEVKMEDIKPVAKTVVTEPKKKKISSKK